MSHKTKAIPPKRLIHLAEGNFSHRKSKMTTGVLRYGYHHSLAVIDSTRVGETANQVIGFGGDVPVVASLRDALDFQPEAILVGITPAGGRLPDDMKQTLLEAIEHGLDVYAGLHDFLTDDPELVAAAKRKGVMLWDIRKPDKHLPVGGGLTRWSKSYISLMVGSDCAIGKMTVALEIDRAAKARGIDCEFVATGQCGIAIAGWGSPIDAIPGDFMAGCVERDVLTCEGSEIILVEGQGSLLHPGFSSVTLGLVHGSCPDSFVLCHQITRREISNIREVPIPSLDEVMRPYIDIVRPFKPNAKLVGVSFNSVGVSDEEAKAAIADAEKLLGVPATDPIRYGAEKLVEAMQKHRKEIGK